MALGVLHILLGRGPVAIGRLVGALHVEGSHWRVQHIRLPVASPNQHSSACKRHWGYSTRSDRSLCRSGLRHRKRCRGHRSCTRRALTRMGPSALLSPELSPRASRWRAHHRCRADSAYPHAHWPSKRKACAMMRCEPSQAKSFTDCGGAGPVLVICGKLAHGVSCLRPVGRRCGPVQVEDTPPLSRADPELSVMPASATPAR